MDKVIVRKQLTDVIISRWIKPKGFDLALVDISCQIFNSTLILAVGKWSEFRGFLKKEYDQELDDDEPRALFVYFKNKKDNDRRTNFMFLPTMIDWRAEEYGTICHELHHYTHIALEQIGISQSRESEESFAYFQGYFMEHVIRAIAAFKKYRKK